MQLLWRVRAETCNGARLAARVPVADGSSDSMADFEKSIDDDCSQIQVPVTKQRKRRTSRNGERTEK